MKKSVLLLAVFRGTLSTQSGGRGDCKILKTCPDDGIKLSEPSSTISPHRMTVKPIFTSTKSDVKMSTKPEVRLASNPGGHGTQTEEDLDSLVEEMDRSYDVHNCVKENLAHFIISVILTSILSCVFGTLFVYAVQCTKNRYRRFNRRRRLMNEAKRQHKEDCAQLWKARRAEAMEKVERRERPIVKRPLDARMQMESALNERRSSVISGEF